VTKTTLSRPPSCKEDAVPASYFDVDGTLVTTNLLHPTLFYIANQQSPMQSLERIGRALLKSPRLVLAEMVDRRQFNELLFSVYEGISEDRLLLLADEAFDTVLRRSLFPEARALVARCREQGDVVLVSGALDFLMKRLAAYLGATDVIANRLEIKDGKATGRMLRPVVAGPEKARLVREHARAKGYDLDDCFAYSDSYSDVPMLSVVGHPAAVNPDARLARLARTYGWPVMTLKKVPGPRHAHLGTQ
jgi:HAD superfamily hydrolase (TIGR01490 family)